MTERHRGAAVLNLIAGFFVLAQAPPSPVTTITSNGSDRQIDVLTQPWLVGLAGVVVSGLLFIAAAVLLWRGTSRRADVALASTFAFILSLYFAAELRADLDVAGVKVWFNTVFLGLAASIWGVAIYWRARLERQRVVGAS